MAASEIMELVVRVSPEGTEETSESLQEVEETFDSAAESTKESANVMDRFARRWRGAMTVVASALAVASGALLTQVPIVSDLMDGLFAIVEAVALQMDQFLRPALQGVVMDLFGLAEAILEAEGPTGDLIGALGTLAAILGGGLGIGFVLSQLGLLGGSGGLLGLLGPIGLVVAAIGGLAAAWVTDFLGIRTWTEENFPEVAAVINGVFDTIEEAFAEVTDAALQTWATYGDDILRETEESFNAVVDFIGGILTWLWEETIEPALSIIAEAWDTHGQEIFDEIAETYLAIQRHIQDVLQFLEDFWAEWGDEIMLIVRPILDTLEFLFDGTLDTILTLFKFILNVIQGDWEEAWQNIADFVDRNNARIEDIFEDLRAALFAIWDRIVAAAVDAGNRLVQPFRDAWAEVQELKDKITGAPGRVGRNLGARIGSLGAGFGFETGGRVTTDGLAQVHAGEEIVPAAQVEREPDPTGGTNRFAEREELVVRFEPARFEQFLSSRLESGPANTGRGSGPQG